MSKLEINGLTKRYFKNAPPALDNFTYTFTEGVYGLLGPNGAGKSTMMNMIVGNLSPDSGEILLDGKRTSEMGKDFRQILGYMPQQQQLYETFTVSRFLFYFAALKGLSKREANTRIRELLKLVNLEDAAGKRLKNLSGGMKQRVLLAQALLNDPEILILDEPTAGLDPKERMNIRNYIYGISKGKIIILATHVISDIEQIAKEVIFLRTGETVLSGTPEEVIREVSGEIWEVELPKEEYDDLNMKYPRNRVTGERNGLVNVKIIAESQPDYEKVADASVSLEDVYLDLYP